MFMSKKYTMAAACLVSTLHLAPVAVASPMIDDAHDRVQTTLDPMLDRIGTLTPRSAREIGPSHIAIGCEILIKGLFF